MRDGGVGDPAPVGGGEPDAVREDRPGADQSGAVVDLDIPAAEAAPHRAALLGLFGQVRLDRQVTRLRQIAARLQQFLRARQRKTRRDREAELRPVERGQHARLA